MLGVVHFLYAATPPPPPPSPQYNLQLYGYNQVRSPHFPPNTCGNKWLDLYNAASHTSGGIGSCGSTWDTTVDDMISVGLQDDPVNMPWPNGTKAREQVVHDFCDCIHCSFLPAVNDTATLVIPNQCQSGTPSLPSVIYKLALSLCHSTVATSANACPGYVYAAQTRCEQHAEACGEVEFVLGVASVADFDAAARAAFLANLATYANVPIESLYIKSVRAASIVATVGVLTAYADDLEAAILPGGAGGAPSDGLSSALGVPVQAITAEGGAGGAGGVDAVPIVVVIVLLLVAIALYLRWRRDRFAGLLAVTHVAKSGSAGTAKADATPKAQMEAGVAHASAAAAAADDVVVTVSHHDLEPTSAPASSLKMGGRVELMGLKSAVHLNGTRGVLVEFKEDEGRWIVKLDGDNNEHERMTVKPANLVGL